MNAAARFSAATWCGDLDRNRRFGLVGGVVAILAAATAFAWFSLHSDFLPLTGGLSKEDTAATVAQLEDIRARYRVDPSTGAVLVPAAEIDTVRAQLAQKGWPLKPAAGFELFDSGDFGMTEFTERINYQRALEGELARTIMELDEVRYARVHLVLPQSSLFKKSGEPPKASVLLVGRHGDVMSAPQIAGIQRMVASAVPELKAENVSVHDHKGVELTSGAAGALSPEAVDTAIRAQSDVEDFLSAKAEEILLRVFPDGTATVSVNATLTRSQVSSVRDEVLPSGQGSGTVSHIRSDTLPDVVSAALPHLARDPAAAPHSDAAAPEFDVEYRIGHLTEQSESAPGGIERLSVGVVIPDPSAQGLTVDNVRELVAAGIGIDAQRGDRIAVYPVASLTKSVAAGGAHGSPSVTGPDRAAPGPGPAEPKPYWALLLGIAALLGAVLVWLGRPRRHQTLTAAEREEHLNKVRQWLQQ